MSDAPRTHRDTLAFVLTMAGATCWAVFPVAGIMSEHGVGSGFMRLCLSLVAGGFLGALAAATVVRSIALLTAGVAGALCAGLAIGAIRFVRVGALPLEVTDLAVTISVAIAAVGGAALGRRSRRAWPGLVVALITLSTVAICGAGLAILESLGHEHVGLTVLAMFVAPIPAIVLGMVAFREARPGAVAGSVFVVLASMNLIMAVVNGGEGSTFGMILGGMFFSALAAGGTAIVASLTDNFRPKPSIAPTVPVARVR